MSKQPGTGEYMSIAMGYSVYGTDIYVKEEQKAKAEALINALLYDDGESSDDEEIKLPWWQNKRIVAGCFLGFLFWLSCYQLFYREFHIIIYTKIPHNYDH